VIAAAGVVTNLLATGAAFGARFLSVHFCLTIRIRPIANSDG
jgi:hypothetical protein